MWDASNFIKFAKVEYKLCKYYRIFCFVLKRKNGNTESLFMLNIMECNGYYVKFIISMQNAILERNRYAWDFGALAV